MVIQVNGEKKIKYVSIFSGAMQQL